MKKEVKLISGLRMTGNHFDATSLQECSERLPGQQM